jgi:hypothetical protein
MLLARNRYCVNVEMFVAILSEMKDLSSGNINYVVATKREKTTGFGTLLVFLVEL